VLGAESVILPILRDGRHAVARSRATDRREHRQAAGFACAKLINDALGLSEIYSQADVGGGASLSVRLHSRTAAILAHASAAYFNLFLSAGFDARAARSRHCLACCLYSATTCIASRYYAGELPVYVCIPTLHRPLMWLFARGRAGPVIGGQAAQPRRGAADRGEHFQAARATAEAMIGRNGHGRRDVC